jgi:hypothetical protein
MRRPVETSNEKACVARGYALALADAIAELGLRPEDVARVARVGGMGADEMGSIWPEGEAVRTILQPVIDALRDEEDDELEASLGPLEVCS